MRQRSPALSRWFGIAALAICLALLPSMVNAYTSRAEASSQSANISGDKRDEQVVNMYFKILNNGMRTGDFSALSTVYAPDATLRQSTPKGVTSVIVGLPAIIKWYEGFRARFPGMQFTRTGMRSLAPHVFLSYEAAGFPTWVQPGRCMHVFTLERGWIYTLDWATYFGGQPA